MSDYNYNQQSYEEYASKTILPPIPSNDQHPTGSDKPPQLPPPPLPPVQCKRISMAEVNDQQDKKRLKRWGRGSSDDQHKMPALPQPQPLNDSSSLPKPVDLSTIGGGKLPPVVHIPPSLPPPLPQIPMEDVNDQQKRPRCIPISKPSSIPDNSSRTSTELINYKGLGIKLCKEEGCTNVVQNNRVCAKHGATKTICKIEGCANKVINNGVCTRHGAKRVLKICTHQGCTNLSRNNGVCTRHGAVVKKVKCGHQGCNNIAQSKGLCDKHNGRNAKKVKCGHQGCNNIAQRGGLCDKHNGRDARRALNLQCKVEGCTNGRKKNGVCRRHGADK